MNSQSNIIQVIHVPTYCVLIPTKNREMNTVISSRNRTVTQKWGAFNSGFLASEELNRDTKNVSTKSKLPRMILPKPATLSHIGRNSNCIQKVVKVTPESGRYTKSFNKDVDKPYRCVYCPRTFSHKGYLKMHLVSHTDDAKPYECGFCKKKFAQKGHMMMHMKHHKKFSAQSGKANENSEIVQSNERKQDTNLYSKSVQVDYVLSSHIYSSLFSNK